MLVELLIAAVPLSLFFAISGYMVFATYVTKLDNAYYKLPVGWMIALMLALILGIIGDVVYNVIVGTFRYRELPRWLRGEFMYSGRVRRHFKKHDQSDWRCRTAQIDADLLNTILPGHIDP